MRTLGLREAPYRGALDRGMKNVAVGTVMFVDNERRKCVVQTLTGSVFSEVRWLGSWGVRSGALRIPEFGDTVLMLREGVGGNSKEPVIIDTIPFAIEPSKDFVTKGVMLDSLYALNTRCRKLYEGEWMAGSTQGAEIHLSEDVDLGTSAMQQLLMRSSDGMGLWANLTNVIQTESGLLINGLAVRNSLSDLSKAIRLDDGAEWYVVTEGMFANTLDNGGIPWTEYRHEMREYGDGIPDVTEFTDDGYADGDDPRKDPFIEMVRGTVIGNNPDATALYAKVLKPILFDSWTDSSPNSRDEACSSQVEETTVASCYRRRFFSGTQFDVTKDGKVIETVSADSENVSEERYLEGARKEVIGKEDSRSESVRQSLAGGMNVTVGKDTDGNSVVRVSQGGEVITIGANNDGNGLELYVTGNVIINVNGDVTANVTGSLDATANQASVQASGLLALQGNPVQIN